MEEQAEYKTDTDSNEHHGRQSALSDLLCPTPFYEEDGITIYNADCLDILDSLPPVDAVITDPPYPNNAGHFIEDIATAIEFFNKFACDEWMVFWTEMEKPPVPLPLVAVHIWHRSNTNRPDNYEPIYHFRTDGEKKASRCLSYAVIAKGLTGCHEATGHPTQKNTKLIKKLLTMTKGEVILDPFMGSGTLLQAAKELGKQAIGIEKDINHCQDAVDRLRQGCLSL